MAFDGGKITKWKQGEYEFAIRQFEPFYAIEVLGELNKLIIPAIGGGAAGMINARSLDNKGIMIAALGASLNQLSQNADGKTIEKACRLLLNTEYLAVKPKGGKEFKKLDDEEISAIYTGRVWDMLALCYKVFEVNYMDFSMSSSVPTGVQRTVREILEAMRELVGSTSSESSSSTEQ